jgi:hypothetical protein
MVWKTFQQWGWLLVLAIALTSSLFTYDRWVPVLVGLVLLQIWWLVTHCWTKR